MLPSRWGSGAKRKGEARHGANQQCQPILAGGILGIRNLQSENASIFLQFLFSFLQS